MGIFDFVEQHINEELLKKFGSDYEADPEAYAEKSAQAVPADVRMISGCQDSQTSADVSNVAAFGLPADSGPGGAGGACTNSFLAALKTNPHPTWIELVVLMRKILAEKKYAQIPEISASRQIDLQSPFEVDSEGGGKKRALLVGINYTGQQGALNGCVNDAKSVHRFLQKRGFADFLILADDSEGFGQKPPTAKNILEGFKWLTTGAQAGDSLFFHYSGHGAYVKDTSGDEKDGRDETIVPVDYKTAGQITDDVIFQTLVLPLPQGCQLTALMDCCHSGTVLDLPYLWTASDQNISDAQDNINSGGSAPISINQNFNLAFILKLAKELFQAHQAGTLHEFGMSRLNHLLKGIKI